MTKFELDKYYYCGNLEREGFEAIVQCVGRVEHRAFNSVTLRFIIEDLKINDYNIYAYEFINTIMHGKITILKEDPEMIVFADCYPLNSEDRLIVRKLKNIIKNDGGRR